ncbi:sensor histidine kinase [Calothrix sp. UHCC 0171]|uniref:sensor histidine kinase n=1 Tax=Calothrix sp. UHCC 0171 TaxID=3110245 RepID=UPI002B209BF6|nr:ATP-binding protein [Calothrix sp. UHCC 0171]MEA5569517.1 ATP-binding protein [Calothrix sp. UHCC 0171]
MTDIFTSIPDVLCPRLDSTLQELSLWQVQIDLNCPGDDLIKLFEQESLLPGIILTKNQYYVGMISRRRFFEYMSRPYSLGLFSNRPIENLYNIIQPEVFVLPEDTLILEATHKALARSPQVVYEPIVVQSNFSRYGLLDFHHLLLAHSRIHVLTVAQLQQAEEQSRVVTNNLVNLQHNYSRLVQNEKMAALGQLVAGVAHEINNPVNFIYGNLSHIRTYINDLVHLLNIYQETYPQPVSEIEKEIDAVDLEFIVSDLPRIIDSMKFGTERIQEIVLSLRNFSRLDEADLKQVNIHEGIESTLLILHNRLKAKPNHPEVQIIKNYTEFPEIECFPGQLNQVFMNILVNAIDVLEEELNPCIEISTQLLNDNWVAIHISDNGCGIDEEIMSKLFDPFFTTKDVNKGTGLGLSISHQIIVDKHKGKLYCESTPGKGAKFVIEIPIRQSILS